MRTLGASTAQAAGSGAGAYPTAASPQAATTEEPHRTSTRCNAMQEAAIYSRRESLFLFARCGCV